MAHAVGMFGAASVFGRVLYAREAYRMAEAKKIYDAYKSREGAEDWTEWAKKNEQASEILNKVEIIING